MYDLAKIQTNFLTGKLITFKASSSPEDYILDPSLTGTSLSGLYFNKGNHSYLTNQANLESIAPNFFDFVKEDYNATTTYVIGEVVYDPANNKFYSSKVGANTGNALTDTNFWTEKTYFSDWLTERVTESIENTLQKTIKATPLIDNEQLYRVADPETDVVENKANTKVGLMFQPSSSNYLRFILNRIGMQFVGTAQDLDLELWNQNELIQTITISLTDGGLNWTIPTDIEKMIMNTNKSGPWFLLYNQDDLTAMNAVGENTLFPQHYNYQKSNPGWFEFFDISGISVSDTMDLNDVDINDLVFSNNFGLNLDFTIMPDLTDFITKNRTIFSDVLHLEFAREMLQHMLDNPNVNVNRTERNLNADNLKYQLRSDDKHTIVSRLSWEKHKLKKAIEKMGWNDGAFRPPVEFNYDINTM